MRGQTTAFPSYDVYSTQELLHAYSAGPKRLAEVLQGLTEEDFFLRARGSAAWSIQEIVLHVTDSEIQGVFRIRKVWSEPGAELPGYDQNAWTRELAHQQSNAAARALNLQLFTLLRQATVPLFEGAQRGDWERSGVHPEYGSLSLRNLLELYADHSERHIQQILEIRERLGKPLKFALLLPQRLY